VTAQRWWAALDAVPDPEIPVISITDLGIVRALECNGEHLVVTVTPTYSGCPATDVIKDDIHRALRAAGADTVEIRVQLTPAWTTDWLSPAAREALRANGIAPPCARPAPSVRTLDFHPPCPRCGSHRSECLSEFGATPCKSLHRCLECREPFEYFKPI
jgi:ring-1,2-phenylacetyl-CoA epoxidase subunit PaaD